MSPEKCRVRQKLRQKGGDRQKIKINRCPKEQVEKGKEAQREVCRRDPEKQISTGKSNRCYLDTGQVWT